MAAINGSGGADTITPGVTLFGAEPGPDDDTIAGLAGADLLDGGGGADSLAGGGGADTYLADAPDAIVEDANQGTDLVVSRAAVFSLGANLENLAFSGTVNATGTGNTLNNVITGNAGANSIAGLAGADTLNGGTGRDTLAGGQGADLLDGGGGADSMVGGLGNDTFVVNNAGDLILEASTLAGETDLVIASVNWTLGANLENLTLTGNAALSGRGNSLANSLIGNAAANTLAAGGNADTLDGGAGADSLVGGAGNDVFIVDNALDLTAELADGGADTVRAAIGWTLADHIEALALTGTAAAGTGNALANRIEGNASANTLGGAAGADTLVGGDGNDTVGGGEDDDVIQGGSGADSLNGDAGADTLDGGTGADTIRSGGGADSVLGGGGADSIDIGSGPATADGGAGNDTILGGSGNGPLLGDEGDDLIVGRASGTPYTMDGGGGNDSLNGNAGAESLVGGTGNDTIAGNFGADTIVGGAGADLLDGADGSDVLSYAADTAGVTVNLGNPTGHTGGQAQDDTITGFEAVIGGSGNDSLTGDPTANTLDGAAGADTLAGGNGGDVFVVDSALDLIVEAEGGGADTVRAALAWTLADNIEGLALLGTAAIGLGNALANRIAGNAAANTLDGAAGADTLEGGAGGDLYIVDSIADLVAENSTVAGEVDEVRASVAWTLADNIENLVLTAAAAFGLGNGLANRIAGNDAANTLDGGAGADTLVGGAGEDVYVVDDAGDVLVDTAPGETDLVRASIAYTLGETFERLELFGSAAAGTGNALDNLIVAGDLGALLQGAAGADTLQGGAGSDVLIGGAGNDVYIVTSQADLVVEDAPGDVDEVRTAIAAYTLPGTAFIEILTYTGTSGVALNAGDASVAQRITGGPGNDTLTGRGGADTLVGGAGNDLLAVDGTADLVLEDPGGGADTVLAGGAGGYSITLAPHVEFLLIDDFLFIDGNGNDLGNEMVGNDLGNRLSGLGGDDRLDGRGGADTLDGGAGADTMIGGAGNDVFVVDDAADFVPVSGLITDVDQVRTALASYALPTSIEVLTWTGAGAASLAGNAVDNRIVAGSGGQTLDGGAGADTLVGGTGDDVYVVDDIGDVVTESATSTQDGVADAVFAGVTFTLGANVEDLTLLAGFAIGGSGNSANNRITGNELANRLIGQQGNDSLAGGEGADTLLGSLDADTLDGGGGNDRLEGGSGNDLYLVGLGDIVVEDSTLAGEIDEVRTALSHTLSLNVEVLTLTGFGGTTGVGNGLNNTLSGNTGSNLLDGGSGNDSLVGNGGADTLRGGIGLDTLSGGSGNDVFLFDVQASGNDDRVSDYASGADRLGFDMSVLKIGDEDTVAGFQARSGTWDATAEVVHDITNLAGTDIATIGAEFSSAGAAVAAGRRVILIAESTAAGGSGIYLFTSDGDADVETAELIQLGFVPGIFEFTAGDILFVP